MSDSREPGELCRGLQEGGHSKLPAFPPGGTPTAPRSTAQGTSSSPRQGTKGRALSKPHCARLL